MGVYAQGQLVLAGTVVLYLIIPTILFRRGMYARAGIAMMVISGLPFIWQAIAAPNFDKSGLDVFAAVLLPIPIVVIVVSIASLVYRGIKAKGREDRS